MSREKAAFRDTMADLNRVFPVQGALTKSDVAMFLGVSRSTVTRMGIPFNPVTKRITKGDLARKLCL